MGRKRTRAERDIGENAGVLPYHGLAAAATGNPGSADILARRARAADDAYLQTQSARYGSLFKTVGGLAPETTPILYADPFALLDILCTVSASFARFLGRCIGEAQPDGPRIVLYCDDVRPGDVHRPGHNRLFCSVYWTLTCFPDWYRTSDVGWLSLCYYKRGDIDDALPGGVSAFTAEMLKAFYPCGDLAWNFESTGVRLPDGRGGEQHFRAPFAGLLADGKALCEAVDGNGSS